ncbi:MAG: DUF3108 domain-containing protein [Gammaproteobacteria bacterium]|nr:DUF3108 domain-containing protein [Gammaproteobacteria bacterium]
MPSSSLLTRVLAALLCLGAGGTAAALPESFMAEFAVTSNGSSIGRTTWTLDAVDEGRYRFRSETRATGFMSLLFSGRRTEQSLWTHHEGRVRPLAYRYVRTGRKAREVEVIFDWDAGQAINRHEGNSWKLDVTAGTQDKLVYLLALMQDLARGARDLVYPIADGGYLKEYAIERQARERLDTPLGTFHTVRLYRQDPKGKRHTTLWAAPELDYLPVKVQQDEKDGDVLAMTLESLKGIRALAREDSD